MNQQEELVTVSVLAPQSIALEVQEAALGHVRDLLTGLRDADESAEGADAAAHGARPYAEVRGGNVWRCTPWGTTDIDAAKADWLWDRCNRGMQATIAAMVAAGPDGIDGESVAEIAGYDKGAQSTKSIASQLAKKLLQIDRRPIWSPVDQEDDYHKLYVVNGDALEVFGDLLERELGQGWRDDYRAPAAT